MGSRARGDSMAKKVAFVTGSNAKIKINNIVLAYATDVQYDVTVQTIPVEVMGRYEVLSNEPIATVVSGSFSVVRYTKSASSSSIVGAAKDGNGLGKWGTGPSASDPGLAGHINPAKLLTSETVDIDLFQNTSDGGTQDFLKITDVRLTRMSGSVNKRGILMESFAFVGILLDNESFEAGVTDSKTDLA